MFENLNRLIGKPVLLSLLLLLATIPYALSNESLVNAARSGDLDAIDALLEAGVDVDSRLPDTTTAILWAVYEEQSLAIGHLLTAGANPTLGDRYGITPLYMAAMNGNAEIVAALLNAGADANGNTPSGETILMIAARTGTADVISLLLEAGADVNASEATFNQTALMIAVRENHPDTIALLLGANANPNVHTVTGEIPEFSPPCKGTGCGSEGVGINRGGLPDHGKRDATKGGMTPLLYAARDGHYAAAELLILANADIEGSEANGIRPLLSALINGQLEVANLLLDHGAMINVDDFWGRSPLWAAVEYRNMDMNTKEEDDPVSNHVDRPAVLPLITRLLDAGANIDFRTREVPPPRRWLYVLNDVSWVDYSGQTAFLRAAFAGDTTVMNLLLEYGADATISTYSGTTALMAAAGVGWVVDQTYTESFANLMQSIEICLEQGVDINASNSMGLTALLGAANKGANDIIIQLVDNGADLFVADVQGRTPHLWAEGVFLAAVGAEQKPHTLALLDELINTANEEKN